MPIQCILGKQGKPRQGMLGKQMGRIRQCNLCWDEQSDKIFQTLIQIDLSQQHKLETSRTNMNETIFNSFLSCSSFFDTWGSCSFGVNYVFVNNSSGTSTMILYHSLLISTYSNFSNCRVYKNQSFDQTSNKSQLLWWLNKWFYILVCIKIWRSASSTCMQLNELQK